MFGGSGSLRLVCWVLWWVFIVLTKWCPDVHPCLSSMCAQVEVSYVPHFPQLVEHVYEGVYFNHGEVVGGRW